MRNLIATLAIAAISTSFMAFAVTGAHADVQVRIVDYNKVDNAAQRICPIVNKQPAEKLEAYLVVVAKEAGESGYGPTETKLLVNKCRNWKG